MVIEMNCPECDKSIRTDDKNGGKKGRCPGCGTSIVIPSAPPEEPADWEELEDGSDDVYDAEEVSSSAPRTSQRNRQASTNLAPDGRPMKECPKCGEQILAVAARCRYCKSTLSNKPGEGAFMVWRDGPLLVMEKTSKLPDRCVKSNQPANGLTLKRKLSWHPPLIYLVLLFNIIIYAIVAVCVQKTATIYIGLTREWAARRRWRILFAWIGTITGIVVMIVGFAAAEGNSPLVWLIPIGIVGWISAIIYGVVGARLVVPTKINETHVWLKGVHPDYLEMLPEWPGES